MRKGSTCVASSLLLSASKQTHCHAFVQSMRMCEHCAKVRPRMSVCVRCCCATYCSAACQKQAWPAHKAFCKELRDFAAEFNDPPGKLAWYPHLFCRVHLRVRASRIM